MRRKLALWVALCSLVAVTILPGSNLISIEKQPTPVLTINGHGHGM